MKVEGKTVVVTGAGGGIGRQLAIQLLAKGASVAAVDIRMESLEQTKQAAGKNAARLSLHTADITDRKLVCSLPKEIEDRHGGIDILINNAGIIQPFVPFAELDYETIQRVMNINVFGMMYMTRAFLPYLAEHSEAYIANVSSMGGFLPVPGQALYGASKAAVKLLTEALRSELTGTGIGVSVIMPGGVSTGITENSGVKMDASKQQKSSSNYKMTTPEEAASVIINGIMKNKPRILVGSDAKFMDFLSRMAPVQAAKYITKMMASLVEDRTGESASLRMKGCLGFGEDD